MDTNTIYPPQLEFKWRDYTFNTGSSISTILNTPQSIISLTDNPSVFYSGSVNNFRIKARPEFPTRVFTTSSVYTQNYYLPTSSYYAVKDLSTNEYVIDFDSTYTQISADSTSSYFTIFMDGLQPERNYKIFIKTIIGSDTKIFSDGYIFKVVNG